MNKEKIRRILKWVDGKKTNPHTLEIRPTFKCNLRCRYCDVWKVNKKKIYDNEMSDKRWIEIMEEANELNVSRIEIVGGGEPLARFNLIEKIIGITKNSGINRTMTTNGTLFTSKIAKKFVENNWNLIAFSIDSPIESTQDRIRGVKGTFKKIIKSINLINSWKKDLNKTNPKIIFVPVLSNKNFNEMSELIKLAKKLHVKEIYFKPLHIFDIKCNDADKMIIEKRQIEKVNKTISKGINISKELEIKTNLNSFLKKGFIEKSPDIKESLNLDIKRYEKNSTQIPCFLPFYHISINPIGMAWPCTTVPVDQEHESVRKNSLKEVWYGKKFNEFRKTLMNGNIPERCRGCCGGSVLNNQEIRYEISNLRNE